MPSLTTFLIPAAIGATWAFSLLVVRRLDARGELVARGGYYFAYAGLWAILPVFSLLAVWSLWSPEHIAAQLAGLLPADYSDFQGRVMLDNLPAMAAGDIAVAPGMAPLVDAYLASAARYDGYAAVGLAAIFLAGLAWAARRLFGGAHPRTAIEKFTQFMLFIATIISVLTTVGIVMSVLFETIRFFEQVPLTEFLFGSNWSPQTALRVDQVGSSGAFGAAPLFVGTLLISAIALLVAVPVGLISAVYLSEYASDRVRATVKPLLEVLAGIPTVVYGFFAALLVAPALQDILGSGGLGFNVSTENALSAGVVMGVMLIPFISSLSDDVLKAVPRNLYEGSLALGATRLETISRVMMPAAFSGIVSSILLAASRAVGETMIVVMSVGLAASLTLNPLESTTTVTVQIQSLLVGDQEFDSAKTLSAFALGFVLLLLTLAFNVVALYVVRKYREVYE